LFTFSLVVIIIQIVRKLLFPSLVPEGLLSISVLVTFLGSLNLLAIAIVGEYVGRILEETKKRPRYVRRLVTECGVTRSSSVDQEQAAARS
jgi:dolichol-phosphate mannosyltransferase